MARELRRLLIDPARLVGTERGSARVALAPQEEHYLARVLRLRPGDGLVVVDGCGGLWQARRGEGDWLELLERSRDAAVPASPSLTLALAMPRQDIELVWRMATELGIDRLQPLRSERSQTGGRREATERWQAVVREATEQCERLWLPSLEPVREAMGWLSDADANAETKPSLRLLATTRREELPHLEGILAAATADAEAANEVSAALGAAEDAAWQEICLAIGPEGGWSPLEEQRAEASGWLPVSLGGTILRTTTAAIAASSRLVAWRDLSCGSCREPSPGNRPDQHHRGGDHGAGHHRR